MQQKDQKKRTNARDRKHLQTRRLEALTWDALIDEWVHAVTLVIRGQQKFNVDSVQHEKRCYFSLVADALNTRKSQVNVVKCTLKTGARIQSYKGG